MPSASVPNIYCEDAQNALTPSLSELCELVGLPSLPCPAAMVVVAVVVVGSVCVCLGLGMPDVQVKGSRTRCSGV